MLAAYPAQRPDISLNTAGWVDLFDPTDEEKAAFEDAFGLHVPTSAQIVEIEATSRLRIEHGALYMTAPLLYAPDDEPWTFAPTGFVLTERVLLTVRARKLAPFYTVAKELGEGAHLEPAQAFVRLLECSIDRMADLLESTANDLDEASHRIFQPNAPHASLAKETAQLRLLMIRTGRTSERMARIHYTLVCLDRIAKFAHDRAHDWIPPDVANRLHTVSSDIASLIHFAEGLVSRVQLLQDAATGIINIDQNNVMKVLTVASVVGIPPVLVVGLYGMNFKYMPELEWSFGYPYAVALMVVSGVIPLIWFKLKDWI